jgi:hypothetical protein
LGIFSAEGGEKKEESRVALKNPHKVCATFQSGKEKYHWEEIRPHSAGILAGTGLSQINRLINLLLAIFFAIIIRSIEPNFYGGCDGDSHG